LQKSDVKKFKTLVESLKDNLKSIKVYRIGTRNIDVYIIGETLDEDLAGISTKVIET
jgi:hypothetical protein